MRIGPNLANNLLLGPNGVPPVVPNYPYIASTTSDGSSAGDVNRSATEPMTPEPGLPTVGLPVLKAAPTGFGAATARAHADKSPYADASGTVASVNLGLITVGSITGESSAKQALNVVSATTTTTMSGIDIAKVAGTALLHIGSAVATATITTSGPGTAKTTQSVTYSGVTVAKLPATIDDTGLHVGGNGISAAAANTALNLLVSTLKTVHFQLIAPHATGATTADGNATSTVDGFGLSYTDDKNVSALVSLGHAELKAHALPGSPITSSGSDATSSQLAPFDTSSLGFFTRAPMGRPAAGREGRRVQLR